MLVISPARSSERITLPAEGFGKIISSAGTESYGGACIELLEMLLGVDHWALFQYPSNTSISCLVMASRTKAAVVRANIDKFLGGYHSFDPSLAILRREPHEQPCVVNIDISDIKDRQYRQCFEATDTRERLSYFTTTSNDLNQLSIYRGPERRAFSQAEMTMFATLGSLIMATVLLHETRCRTTFSPAGPMTLTMMQQRLAAVPGGLSARECEVCARAIAGLTIEGTALDLNIRKTSVITYRQRAYQKLGISSLNELVGILHNLKLGSTAHRGALPLRSSLPSP